KVLHHSRELDCGGRRHGPSSVPPTRTAARNLARSRSAPRACGEFPKVNALFRRARISRRRPRLAISLLAAFLVAGQAAIAFAVADPAAPDTAIEGGPSGLIASPDARFEFSSPQAAATFACRLDFAPFAPCASPQVLTGLADGSHTFQVRARDAAGQADPTPASRTFAIDTHAPPVAIDSGPSGPTDDPRPAFAFSSSEAAAAFSCSIDTGTAAFAACSAPGTDQPLGDLTD